ncbi:MAG: hypothetical protein MUF10_04605 [Thermoanaerobaculaceae bacterium]|jgi:hypothetical protein|nr:hypothetical protein [Thermoanaerobaculaceae bacterium]
MLAQHKLAFGATLAGLGGVAIVVGPLLGVGSLGRPWAFLAGFLAGVAAGSGAVLSLAGLLARRAS